MDLNTVDAGWLQGTVTELYEAKSGKLGVAVSVGGDVVYDVDTGFLQCLAAPGTFTGDGAGAPGAAGPLLPPSRDAPAPVIHWRDLTVGSDVDVLVWRDSRCAPEAVLGVPWVPSRWHSRRCPSWWTARAPGASRCMLRCSRASAYARARVCVCVCVSRSRGPVQRWQSASVVDPQPMGLLVHLHDTGQPGVEAHQLIPAREFDVRIMPPYSRSVDAEWEPREFPPVKVSRVLTERGPASSAAPVASVFSLGTWHRQGAGFWL